MLHDERYILHTTAGLAEIPLDRSPNINGCCSSRKLLSQFPWAWCFTDNSSLHLSVFACCAESPVCHITPLSVEVLPSFWCFFFSPLNVCGQKMRHRSFVLPFVISPTICGRVLSCDVLWAACWPWHGDEHIFSGWPRGCVASLVLPL